MSAKFEGCIAYIYDGAGNLLTTSKIYKHNRAENSIEVSKSQVLLDNPRCELFILSTPKPYAFSGVAHPIGTSLIITLFHGQEKENRSTARYNLAGKALITSYICDDKKYGLHKPIEADLINISTNGVRFRTSYNMLSVDDSFDFHIKIGGNLKTITAKVVNFRNIEQDVSEYGCIFTGKTDG